MARYTELYWDFLKQRFKILMEYRVNFFIGASSTIFTQSAGLLAIWVVMQHVPDLNGWRYDEVLFIYGMITLAKSINHMFADNLWTLGWQYIRTGAFDRFLVRPIDPLFHLLADRFCHDGIGNSLVGAALLVKSSVALQIEWTALKAAYLVIAVASGGMIFIAINLITSALSFWMMDSLPIMWAIFGTHEFARFPLTIYRKGITVVMTWVLPYGFTAFYPAQYILEREAGLMPFLAPVVGFAALAIGYRMWHFGLSRYASTGS